MGLACCNGAPISEHELAPSIEFTQRTLDRFEHRKVDILFVIDDSSSMAGWAANVAEGMADMGQAIGNETSYLDVRLAVTTTSNTHPACGGSPTDGAFVHASCRMRDHAFVSNGDEGDPGSVLEDGCAARCDIQAATKLDDGLLPTRTASDPTPRPRPWIEFNQAASNLPEGLGLPEALACLGPQGVAGCRFEEPLEASWKSVERMLDGNAAEFGFMRNDASLLIVVLTDEDDCSRSDGEALLDPDADSSTCWELGADCSMAGDELVCEESGTDELRPVDGYSDLIQQIDAQKRQTDPELRAMLTVVGGVQPGGIPQTFEEPIHPLDLPFGRAAGCDVGLARAYPMVRLTDVAASTDPDMSTSSICADTSVGIAGLFEFVGPPLRTHCFDACPLDTDPETDALEPDCIVEQTIGVEEPTRLEPCLPDGDSFAPPPGETACHVELTRREPGSPTSMSYQCVDEGRRLEFRIVRTTPVVDEVWITTTCAVSPYPDIDC